MITLQSAFGLRFGVIVMMAAMAMPASLSSQTNGVPTRERLPLNSDWRFAKDDPAEARGRLDYAKLKAWMLPTGSELVLSDASLRKTKPAGNIGAEIAYTSVDFDDSGWKRLDLPHDWGIEGPFDIKAEGATGKLPYAGVGWYRKKIAISAEDLGKRVYLDIDGAMSYANVWVNGNYAGGWAYGYTSFRVDMSPYLRNGADNLIAIRLDNPQNSSRWYPGGGIYRKVWLVKTGAIHVAKDGAFVSCTSIDAVKAKLSLDIMIDNDSEKDSTLAIGFSVFELDADGRKGALAATSGDPVALIVRAGGSAIASAATSVPNPRLWSLDSPNRYLAVANITSVAESGRILDEYEILFGLRSLVFDPEKGVFLNGSPIELRGVCLHHDLGALGAATNVSALRRRLTLLKELGCNAIRTSHNPPAPELLDLTDELGFLVLDEAFDGWAQTKTPNDYGRIFADWSELDLRAFVRRDRNHPSVMAWSIGNEVREQGSAAGKTISARLARIVREEDPSRPVAVACDNVQAGFNGFQAAAELFGYNYVREPGQYPRFHTANPTKLLFSSESASTISSRGEYAFPPADSFDRKSGGAIVGANPQMSSYDLYAPWWATTPDTEFKAQDEAPFVAGEFVWTGFDYLGEPTRNTSLSGSGTGTGGGPSDPSRSSFFGIFDLAGFKKDRFYLYQARWRPELPMTHILPHWNWPERVGQTTPVMVYSSGDSVELFLNGQSLGRKSKGQFEYRFRWDDVRYEAGELKAIAYKNGKVWAEDKVATSGKTAQIRLEADRNVISADGQDLAFVTVQLTDAAGLFSPRADNLLQFDLSGPGKLIAVDNGDPTSLAPFSSKTMKAFNGLCLAVVGAEPGQSGSISLVVRSPGLRDAEIKINTSGE